MITIEKILNISNGVTPYEISILNTNACQCLEIVPSALTNEANNTISIAVTFDNVQDMLCVTNCPIRVQVVDANSCVSIEDVTFTDPCTNLPQLTITETAPLNLVADLGFVSYDWSYDTNVLQLNNTIISPNNAIALEPTTGNTVTSTVVTVMGALANGCIVTAEITVQICVPQAINGTLTFDDATNTCTQILDINNYLTPCTGVALDYSTLVLTNTDGLVNIVPVTANTFELSPNVASQLTQNAIIEFTISDVNGVPTNVGILNVTIESSCCGSAPTIEDFTGTNAICVQQAIPVLITLEAGYTYSINAPAPSFEGTLQLNGNVITYTPLTAPTLKNQSILVTKTNACGRVDQTIELNILCPGTLSTTADNTLCIADPVTTNTPPPAVINTQLIIEDATNVGQSSFTINTSFNSSSNVSIIGVATAGSGGAGFSQVSTCNGFLTTTSTQQSYVGATVDVTIQIPNSGGTCDEYNVSFVVQQTMIGAPQTLPLNLTNTGVTCNCP